jgi:hypothetical protein
MVYITSTDRPLRIREEKGDISRIMIFLGGLRRGSNPRLSDTRDEIVPMVDKWILLLSYDVNKDIEVYDVAKLKFPAFKCLL